VTSSGAAEAPAADACSESSTRPNRDSGPGSNPNNFKFPSGSGPRPNPSKPPPPARAKSKTGSGNSGYFKFPGRIGAGKCGIPTHIMIRACSKSPPVKIKSKRQISPGDTPGREAVVRQNAALDDRDRTGWQR
jgi:hypothetical protein